MPQHVTLRDIAGRAALSASAVSMALRDHPEVSPATRQRVQALAAEMGYRRDPMLSALSAYRHGGRRTLATLAFITTGDTPDCWRTPYGEMQFAGASSEAHRLGYDLRNYWLDPAMPSARHSRILEARGTTGLLIAPMDKHLSRIELDWSRFSAVALGHTLHTPRLARAQSNLYGGLIDACRQLHELGYRRIGLAETAESDAYIDGQWSGAMLKYQSTIPASQCVKPLWHDTYEEDAFRRWLDRQRPDVVIAYGDPFYRWLLATRRRVPEDIGFVLLSDFPRTPQTPPFAALKHNFEATAAAGVGLLHAQCTAGIRGVPDVRTAVVVDTVWVPGRTIRERDG